MEVLALLFGKFLDSLANGILRGIETFRKEKNLVQSGRNDVVARQQEESMNRAKEYRDATRDLRSQSSADLDRMLLNRKTGKR